MMPKKSAHTGAMQAMLDALSATRIVWFGWHEPKEFSPGAAISEALVPTNRMIALEDGELTYALEEEEISCRAGALWLVPEWTRRSWKTKVGARISWVEFSALPQVGPLPAVHAEQWPYEGVGEIPLAGEERPFHEMALKLMLMRLLRVGEWRSAPGEGDLSLHGVITRLREHLGEPDLLMRLPERTGMSPRLLRERFRRAVGMSPGRYLETLRMQQARYLLLSTELSVKEVATQTGFDDPLYFSRRYRLFWNHSPKEHRAQNP